MKKISLWIIMLVGVFSLFIKSAQAIELPEVTDHEIVKVYLFRGQGCGHCQEFINYFYDVADEYKDYFEIVSYETWSDADNGELRSFVDEAIGNDETGVPLIVIGDYYKLGFGSSSGEEIIEEALKAYKDKKYEDVVANTIADNDLSNNPETLEEAYKSEFENSESSGEDNNTTEDSKTNDVVVIVLIFAVVIGGITALVVTSRK